MAASAAPAPTPAPAPADDPAEAARSAGLRYASDARPGIRRERRGSGFRYVDADGDEVTDAETLQRIRHLAIPPAWTDVWISPSPRGHIQATGRDARRRKQYRYHPRWREVRDENKYDRMIAFAEALPAIRERVERDLGLPGLQRDRILAAVVRLLDETFIRVGNEEYAKENRSYGLTTMRTRHVDVDGSRIHFQFRGKAGRMHSIDVRDRRVARVVQRIQDLPGEELFQYLDEDGETRSVDSDDVNGYIAAATGKELTAKDFRTWAGTVLAAQALREIGPGASQREARRNVTRAIEQVSRHLGNTPAVCRRCYVHPDVIAASASGDLERVLDDGTVPGGAAGERDLRPEERAVLRLLQRGREVEKGGR